MKALMTLGGRKPRQMVDGPAFSRPRSPVSIIDTTAYRRRERAIDALIAIVFVASCALLDWAGPSFF